MNTEDKPEWPDIIGSGDYKKALSGGEKVIAQTEASGCVSGEPSPLTQLREIAEKWAWEYERICLDGRFHQHDVLVRIIQAAMQEALSGGEKTSAVVRNTVESPPTQLRKIVGRESWDDRDYMRYCAVLTREQWQQLCEEHKASVLRAMQEAWELGYTQCGHDEYFRDPETTEVHKIKAEDTPA